MKKALRMLVGAAVLYFAHAGAAMAVMVKIDPSGYAGQWTVNYGSPKQGIAWVDLGAPDLVAGGHVISLGGAELVFNVAADGTVVPNNRAAATGGEKTLTFNTIRIKIDPAYFAGPWRVTAGGSAELRGVQYVTLVRGLSFYGLEVGATGAFSFHIGADGTVTVPQRLAAIGGSRSLTLNNTERFLQ